MVARRLADPDLEGRQAFLAAVWSIVDDDVADLVLHMRHVRLVHDDTEHGERRRAGKNRGHALPHGPRDALAHRVLARELIELFEVALTVAPESVMQGALRSAHGSTRAPLRRAKVDEVVCARLELGTLDDGVDDVRAAVQRLRGPEALALERVLHHAAAMHGDRVRALGLGTLAIVWGV